MKTYVDVSHAHHYRFLDQIYTTYTEKTVASSDVNDIRIICAIRESRITCFAISSSLSLTNSRRDSTQDSTQDSKLDSRLDSRLDSTRASFKRHLEK